MKALGFKSVTKFLFVTTQIAALFWVTMSYVIAAYATVRLKIPYPVESLSTQAIITLLGSSTLKVIENIFEHNEGRVFGKSIPPETVKDDIETIGEMYDHI